MKSYRLFTKYSLLACAISVVACTGKFDEYNTNPYEATDDYMKLDDYNLQAAMIAMQGNVVPADKYLYQYMEASLGNCYGGYMADANSGFVGKNFACYNPAEDWYQVPFNDVISKIYANYLQITKVTDDPVVLAVADIIRVAAIHRVTDIYGHIPYSQIGSDGKLEAPYDHQKDVYKYFFEQLEHAVETLTANRSANFNANADKVYGGVVEQWIKFANSLRLRLAMRIVYADETLAKTEAEKAVGQEIGTFATNGDNAINGVLVSPLREVLYNFNKGDSRISADITSYMNGYNDPRREKYFLLSTFDDEEADNGYYGLRSGIKISSTVTAQKYSNVNMEKLEGVVLWMNAAEVAFLKAEGALRGWEMGGKARDFYNKGIELSFEQWGVSGADIYMKNDQRVPEKYKDPLGTNSNNEVPSMIKIKWDDNAGTEMNLERIITQKWIANFPLGNEAWADFRRTGYPHLMEVPNNLSNGVVDKKLMARRLPYPQSEYKQNGVNLRAALDILGGADNLATRVWWDCNPRIKNKGN